MIFYRKETARMFQVTLMARDTLPLINYWFIDQDAKFRDKLRVGSVSQRTNDLRLAQMRKRLNASCKGLLEARSLSPNQFSQAPERDFFYLKVDFLHRTVRDCLECETT
jgi:hypothetical protein